MKTTKGNIKFASHLGFTIVEILTVVAIIGMLVAGVVVTGVGKAKKQARDIATRTIASDVLTALTLYRQEYGQFPCHDLQYSVEESQLNDTQNPKFLSILVDKNLLSGVPYPPNNTYPYIFSYETFKNVPSGPCGRTAVFSIGFEDDTLTTCPFGGFPRRESDTGNIKRTTTALNGKTVGVTFCDIFFPAPLSCSDPCLTSLKCDLRGNSSVMEKFPGICRPKTVPDTCSPHSNYGEYQDCKIESPGDDRSDLADDYRDNSWN